MPDLRRLRSRIAYAIAARIHDLAAWLFTVEDRLEDYYDETDADLVKAWNEGEPVDVAKAPLFTNGQTTNTAVGTSQNWTISWPEEK